MSIKYVPEGVYLVCDRGSCYSQFKVTQNKTASIYGSNLASTGDRWPFVNVKPMGLCLMRGSLCMPSPVLWMNPKGGISIGSNELLLEESTAKCLFGGTIKIYFTLEAAMEAAPWGSVKKPSEYIKEGFDWVFDKLDEDTAANKAWLQDVGAPQWMSDVVDVVDWGRKFTVGAVEGAVNGVVGLGETIYDIAQDPIGVGGAVVDMVSEGVSDAWDWASDGDNWSNAASSAWDWASDGDNWSNAASDTWDWVKGNPRKVGNVAGEVALEVGTAVLTGGSGNAAKAGGKVAKETAEAATKKAAKETAEKVAKETAEAGVKKVAKEVAGEVPEVVTKKSGKEILKNLKPGEKYPGWEGPLDYSDIPNPRKVGEGKNFTKAQKDKIYDKNRKAHDGYLVSDQDGTILSKPQKSQKGVKPDQYEAQLDHKHAKSKGGTNKNDNAQVLSREQNRTKWDK